MGANDKELVKTEELKAAGRQWVEQQRRELKAREDDLEKLVQECECLRRELELMEAWLAVNEGKNLAEKDGAEEEAAGSKPPVRLQRKSVTDLVDGPDLVNEKGIELRGDNLRDEVVKILAESYPQGVYYRDILGRLQKKDYVVGGKDPGLNIIAHIARDPRMKRGEKRGFYTLEDEFAARLNMVNEDQ